MLPQRKAMLQFLMFVITSCLALFQPSPHRLGSRTMRMSTSVATTTGRMLTVQDIASKGRTFANMGMPRVILNKENNEWMLWLHARDENFSSDVVNLSTGRILLATSPDGLTQWKLDEDSPVLNPNKEGDGNWFFFDRYVVLFTFYIILSRSTIDVTHLLSQTFLHYHIHIFLLHHYLTPPLLILISVNMSV